MSPPSHHGLPLLKVSVGLAAAWAGADVVEQRTSPLHQHQARWGRCGPTPMCPLLHHIQAQTHLQGVPACTSRPRSTLPLALRAGEQALALLGACRHRPAPRACAELQVTMQLGAAQPHQQCCWGRAWMDWGAEHSPRLYWRPGPWESATWRALPGPSFQPSPRQLPTLGPGNALRGSSPCDCLQHKCTWLSSPCVHGGRRRLHGPLAGELHMHTHNVTAETCRYIPLSVQLGRHQFD